MFRVYKPKNIVKVRALQLTRNNIRDVEQLLMGRATQWEKDNEERTIVYGLEVPTFEGVKRFPIDSWIIRGEDNSLSNMTNEEFEKSYEVARNVVSGEKGIQIGNGNVQSNNF